MTFAAVNLGILPGGSSSDPNGCTSSLVVGQSVDSGGNTQAVYWDSNNIIHLLTPISGGSVFSTAFSLTLDGSQIFGASTNDSGPQPTVWTSPSYNPAVFSLPGGKTAGVLFGCSSGGAVAVGSVGDNGVGGNLINTLPAVWTGGSGVILPLPASYVTGEVFDCSPDGTVLVGWAGKAGGLFVPIVWTGGPFWAANVLGTLSGGIVSSPTVNNVAQGATNASYSVGAVADSGGNSYAAFWNGLSLAVFGGPIGGIGSNAIATDPTGTLVCGISAANSAALWTNGVGSLLALFPTALSSDYASAISADGMVIVGGGTDAGGHPTAVRWGTALPPPPPPTRGNGFLVCGNDWSIAQPQVQLYGLDNLVGQLVVGLADGVPIGPLFVQQDGSVILPFPASYVTLGVGFTVQLQTPYLDTGNPTIQGRRKDITAATVRVDASAAPMVGTNQPDGGSFTPTQVGPTWSNMQPAVTQDPEQFPGTYLNPSGQTVTLLFSGDFRANLQPGWDEKGQIAVQQTLPLPMAINAVVPELLIGDTAEQAISPPQGGKGEQQSGPGTWMLTSRGRG